MSAWLVLVAVLTVLSAGAQEPDVDEIARRYVEARGGLEAIRAIETLVYDGGLYREEGTEGSGDAFMAFARPYLRVVGNPESPGGFMEGYDGAAWEWFADPGIVIRTVGAASGAARRGADFEGGLVGWREKGSTVELAGTEPVGGRKAYRLILTTRDGFARELFVDAESWLIVAERRSAPFHAFGDPVTSEARIGDYRPVAGVLIPHRFVETVIATGRPLTSMQWSRIEANRELPRSWFSPPAFERTPLQSFLEHLYVQRTDSVAVLWSYAEFRRFDPDVDTATGVELVGYQMLKMGEAAQAVELLEANASDHPDRAAAWFGLGRARATAGDETGARADLERALALEPEHRRAGELLGSLSATGDGRPPPLR
jgi:hypothetical protein